MYSPAIAEGLRERGHDAVSVHDRPELAATSDAALLEAMRAEGRVVVTNNVRDFAPIAQALLQRGSALPGLVFTNDRSLPRTSATIGAFVELLDGLLVEHAADDAIPGTVRWLAPSEQGPS